MNVSNRLLINKRLISKSKYRRRAVQRVGKFVIKRE